MTDAIQTSSAIGLVGDTGSGKTSLINTYAKWLWKRFHKVLRLYTADPGGYGDDVRASIDVGIIQVWRMLTRDPDGNRGLPMETCARATQGYWPIKIDPKTGESAAAVDLVAPITLSFLMICPKGHPVRRAMAQTLLIPTACPTCKVMTNLQNCKEVQQSKVPTPGFEKVGGLAFDGMTSMSDWCLVSDMGKRAAENLLGGEKANILPQISGGMKFGQGNRAAVGFIQNRALEWAKNAISVQGMMAPPIFTFLEAKVTDERTDLPVYGPKIAGLARTTEVPSWIGNCLGTVIWEGDNGPEHRLYLKGYRVPGDNTLHLCKVRAWPRTMPDYLVDDPEKPPFNGFNLGIFMDTMEAESMKAAQASLREEFGEDVPGLPSGQVGGAAPPLAPKKVDHEGLAEGSTGEGAGSPTPEGSTVVAQPGAGASSPQSAAAGVRAPAPRARPKPRAGGPSSGGPVAVSQPAPAEAAIPPEVHAPGGDEAGKAGESGGAEKDSSGPAALAAAQAALDASPSINPPLTQPSGAATAPTGVLPGAVQAGGAAQGSPAAPAPRAATPKAQAAPQAPKGPPPPAAPRPPSRAPVAVKR